MCSLQAVPLPLPLHGIITATGNAMSWFGKIFFFFTLVEEVKSKKRYFLINPDGFEVSDSPAPINCYMSETSGFDNSYKTMKINFPTFAEVSIQRLNLKIIFRRNNRFLFFLRCHHHQLDCKDCLEALAAKCSNCLYQLK